MADQSQQVLERLRTALRDRPEANTQELQAIAAEIDPAVGSLSRRQFNAGYVVPLKRKRGGAAKKGKARGAKKATARGARNARQESPAPRESAGRTGASRVSRHQSSEPGREEIRGVLLQFAQDFAQAETRFEIVNVLSELDRYVDRIVAARG